jgi:hypothetical protein
MFEPAFIMSFAEPIPANILTLVKERWAEASQAVVGEVIAPFKDFTESVPTDANLPCVTIEFARMFDVTNPDSLIVSSTIEFTIALADEDADRGALIKRLVKRARITDSIIRSAATYQSDDTEILFSGIPPESRILLDLDIVEWRPGRDVPAGERHIRAIGGVLRIKLVEP